MKEAGWLHQGITLINIKVKQRTSMSKDFFLGFMFIDFSIYYRKEMQIVHGMKSVIDKLI